MPPSVRDAPVTTNNNKNRSDYLDHSLPSQEMNIDVGCDQRNEKDAKQEHHDIIRCPTSKVSFLQ